MIEETKAKRAVENEKSAKERLEQIQADEKKRQEEQDKKDRVDDSASLGDINLSFFKRISKSTQILIAAGFMAVLFAGLYLCLHSVREKATKKKKKN